MTGELMSVSLMVGAATLLLALMPYWLNRTRGQTDAAHDLAALEEQLKQHVGAVRDLDFDYDMGKLTDEDYVLQRKMLIGRGVSTWRRLRDLRVEFSQDDQALEDLINQYKRQGRTA
ncbi:MAG: hypothetical protein ACLFTK_16855 [Anaerolineales bacterium]